MLDAPPLPLAVVTGEKVQPMGNELGRIPSGLILDQTCGPRNRGFKKARASL